MGPCDDLPAKPGLLHWGRMIRRREPVTPLCRASVNSAIKEHGITYRAKAATFGGNASCVRALIAWKISTSVSVAATGMSSSMDIHSLYFFCNYRRSRLCPLNRRPSRRGHEK
ncbi:hypothetical protein AVEN_29963-1 [Araneus ventricosus]|uniref:Uncharacterized protein n=1 Tax=Araneus ventricosus TaxID=182803 RepID=A0A4Y2PW96_ARAVE|nr:hypothetical protein AVEN_29963-1 [Araneus ventricosus]